MTTTAAATRIIIQQSGDGHYELTTLTRLFEDSGHPNTTAVNLGHDLRKIVGLTWRYAFDSSHRVLAGPLHELLVPWVDLVPQVVAAYAAMWGVPPDEVEVVRLPAGADTWPDDLHAAIRSAPCGATVTVPAESLRPFAEQAAVRKGRGDLRFEVAATS